MKYLDSIDVENKKVALRIDVNLPFDDNGECLNFTGLYRRIAPSFNYLRSKQSSIILLASHQSKKSLLQLSKKIAEHFKVEIDFANSLDEAKQKVSQLQSGNVLMLENLAILNDEQKCDKVFANKLIELCDIYVVDSFSETILPLTSTTTALSISKNSCTGLLIKKELEYYDKSVLNPKRPFCVIVGGAKAAPKIEILRYMVQKADVVLVGGAIANSFLAVQGTQMGRSLIEKELFPKIMEFIALLARRDCKSYFPVDFRIGDSVRTHGMARAVTAQDIPADSMVLDIGPATSILFEEAITRAETILWNGPMGTLENEDYAQGTTQLVQSLAAAHGLTVAGGVATEVAVHNMELEHRFDHLSTGGQAFLDMIQGHKLPGLIALGYK